MLNGSRRDLLSGDNASEASPCHRAQRGDSSLVSAASELIVLIDPLRMTAGWVLLSRKGNVFSLLFRCQ